MLSILCFFNGALKCLSSLQICHVVISRFKESTQAKEDQEDPPGEGGAGGQRHRGRAHRRRQCRGVAVNLEYNDWSGDAVANTQLDSNLYMARLPQDTQVQSVQATLSGAHADCHAPGTNI